MSNDPFYNAARAIEERRRAMMATDPRVRRIHLELAASYAALAGPVVTDQLHSEEQRTA